MYRRLLSTIPKRKLSAMLYRGPNWDTQCQLWKERLTKTEYFNKQIDEMKTM